jgi:hypothetical protein
MTTITIKDLFTNTTRKHGNPIMGIGSKAAVDAVIAYGNDCKDPTAFTEFGNRVASSLRERLANYIDAGQTAKSARVKMTTSAIANLEGFLATFSVSPEPQPKAAPVTKPASRMTKADLMAQIEFLTAQLSAR